MSEEFVVKETLTGASVQMKRETYDKLKEKLRLLQELQFAAERFTEVIPVGILGSAWDAQDALIALQKAVRALEGWVDEETYANAVEGLTAIMEDLRGV